MKIDLICNDGSPLGVIPPHIYGDGVGGAELSMMSLMDTFAKRGHDVTVYNDPVDEGDFGGVMYLTRRHYNRKAPRDVLIVFRSPNPLLDGATAKLRKVWWSTDQYTIGDFHILSQKVDVCVVISAFHMEYHKSKWNINEEKLAVIDLGVRLEDYTEPVEKVKNRMIYCSVPDRGLGILHAAWPLIIKEIPDATLSITADYRLWGASAGNMHHRLNWAGMPGVTFYGKVPRRELVKLQQEAEIMPYPCVYDELFCISAAECAVAGAMPITSKRGALNTTNEFGIQVTGNLNSPMPLQNNFVDVIVDLLARDRDYLVERRTLMTTGALMRFDWDKIAEKWEYIFKEGKPQ